MNLRPLEQQTQKEFSKLKYFENLVQEFLKIF